MMTSVRGGAWIPPGADTGWYCPRKWACGNLACKYLTTLASFFQVQHQIDPPDTKSGQHRKRIDQDVKCTVREKATSRYQCLASLLPRVTLPSLLTQSLSHTWASLLSSPSCSQQTQEQLGFVNGRTNAVTLWGQLELPGVKIKEQHFQRRLRTGPRRRAFTVDY